MSIIVLEDVIVPDCVFTPAVAGRQTRQNDRTVNQGGFASVNVVRDVTIRTYQLGTVPMEIEIWNEIEGLYEVTDAGAYGMLLKDPKDSIVTEEFGALQGYMAGVEFGAVGRGNGTPLYGLRQLKMARSSTRSRSRPVTRTNGTPTMLRGGTPVVIGVAPGNAALSAGPVYVTFVPDQTRSIVAVTVGATTQIELSSAIAGFVVGGRLWIQGMTGTDAALLNDLSHEITNIAGAVYTIAANSAGKTIAVSGQGRRYPQPDETLTWSGAFYVAVQFSDDGLDWDMVKGGEYDGRLIAGPSVSLIEIREA